MPVKLRMQRTSGNVYAFFAHIPKSGIKIAHAAVKKTVVSSKHTVFLAFVVIGNIAIWLVENMIHSSFEFLSISYIVTEGMILLLYSILQDYGITDTPKEAVAVTEQHTETSETIKAFTGEQIESIMKSWGAVDTLSQREKEVLRFLLENKKRKVIADTLFVPKAQSKNIRQQYTASLKPQTEQNFLKKQKNTYSNNIDNRIKQRQPTGIETCGLQSYTMNICRIIANMKKNDFSCENHILQEILRQKDSVVFLTNF